MPRVLVVDDEPAITEVLGEVLTDEGYQVDKVLNGAHALDHLRREPGTDLVLLDLRMPGLSGREVVETMRSDPALRKIPIVLVTAAVPNAEDFPPDGTYQALIRKPFDVADVARRVHELLSADSR